MKSVCSPMYLKYGTFPTIKSVDTLEVIHFSTSNPPTNILATFNITSAKASDKNTSSVFFLFLSIFAKAIFVTFAPFVAFFFRLIPMPSVNLSASTGETFPAIFPGFETEIKTVSTSKKAAPIKISGDVLSVREFKEIVLVFKTTGVSHAPRP